MDYQKRTGVMLVGRETKICRKVYSVGRVFGADVYAAEDAARRAAYEFIRDEHWMGKLKPRDRVTLQALLDAGKDAVALDFYNDHVERGDEWLVQEHEVR